MHKRRAKRRQEGDLELTVALELLEKTCEGNVTRLNQREIDWELIPKALDPLHETLSRLKKVGRGKRKRQQLESLVANISEMIKSNDTVVDFGCGQGHVGLLVAFLFPSSNVILVDNNPEKLRMAKAKLESVPQIMSQVTMFKEISEVGNFDVGVGLHCCGPLTDVVIERCIREGASICISPCCYGKMGVTLPTLAWKVVARGADFNPGPAHTFDVKGERFRRAKRCMNLIDVGFRAECLMRKGYSVSVGSMYPLTCTPKNNILCATNKAKIK